MFHLTTQRNTSYFTVLALVTCAVGMVVDQVSCTCGPKCSMCVRCMMLSDKLNFAKCKNCVQTEHETI